MRNLEKAPKPGVLVANEVRWLEEFLADRDNKTKKYRYRDAEIKAALKAETNEKCVYCESKIGHNTPGDIEHKIPTSKDPAKHFTWGNLTIACGECNRRKNDFYREHDGFLDPYVDDVESLLEHHGPIVAWRAGEVRGEIAVKMLELSSAARTSLVQRKIEKFSELHHLLERYNSEQPGVLKELLLRQLKTMASRSSEYSAMVAAALRSKGMAEIVV
jgi:hypothetical protein